MNLVFDIGATKMRFAKATTQKLVGLPFVLPTPRNYPEALKCFTAAAERLEIKSPKAVAGGLPVSFDAKKNKIISARNLPEWNGRMMIRDLKRIFKSPLFVENDAALAGLGEARGGAGRGRGIVAYWTVSTGVNGVRVVGGRIDSNTFGFKLGRMIIESKQGHIKDLESLVSGAGLQRRYKKTADKISNKKIWREVENYLTIGLYNSMIFWSPEIIVVGGGVALSGKISFDSLNRNLRAVSQISNKLPPVVPARLGDLAGLVGAVEYLKQIQTQI